MDRTRHRDSTHCACAHDAYAGANYNGQLGDGTNGIGTGKATPTLVFGGAEYAQIAAGPSAACAIRKDNNLAECWGASFMPRRSSVYGAPRAHDPPGWLAAAARCTPAYGPPPPPPPPPPHSYSPRAGANYFGVLGDGTEDQRNTPTAVSGGIAFKQISAGTYHTCGIRRDNGRAVCWGAPGNQRSAACCKRCSAQRSTRAARVHAGWNYYGMVGDGSTSDRWAPVAVQSTDTYTSISCGDAHTVALLG